MPRRRVVKTEVTSSLSGDAIPEGTGAVIRIQWSEPNRQNVRADLTNEETQKLVEYRDETGKTIDWEVRRGRSRQARRPNSE
jgi:hypothetical protein